ncbi:MAG TPA: hypothetical protein V6D47_06525 [Oscillatoriaceae cyanobacterium]
MSQTAVRPVELDFTYARDGEVECRNRAGLVFFLRTEMPRSADWKPVEANREVEMRRAVNAKPIVETSREIPQAAPTFTPVAATREVEVRRAEPPAPAPEPVQEPEKGWLGKLFKR